MGLLMIPEETSLAATDVMSCSYITSSKWGDPNNDKNYRGIRVGLAKNDKLLG